MSQTRPDARGARAARDAALDEWRRRWLATAGLEPLPVAELAADLIAALLGPVGPELSCEECFDQLDRYVDLQLEAADTDRAVPGMRAHLAGCPACHEDHESLVELVAAADRPRAS
jgi:hypothetical protein